MIFMGDQTTGRSDYDLRKTSNIPSGQPDSDLMDGVSALWTKSLRMGKIKQEGVHASGLAVLETKAASRNGYDQSTRTRRIVPHELNTILVGYTHTAISRYYSLFSSSLAYPNLLFIIEQ